MLPFMGAYRVTEEKNLPLRQLMYPVPHPINPFRRIRFTLTIDNSLTIGPTEIPIAGREQYSLLKGCSGSDMAQAIKGMILQIRGDAHDFGGILKSEIPKFFNSTLVDEFSRLMRSASSVNTWCKRASGIRAQLVHLSTG